MSATLLPISIQQPFVFYPGNTVPIQWGLVVGSTWNSGNPQPVVDAVGTLTIVDSSGTPVPGADELAFTATDTPGVYQCVIDGTVFSPGPGTTYRTIITMASASLEAQGVWQIQTIIRPRNMA